MTVVDFFRSWNLIIDNLWKNRKNKNYNKMYQIFFYRFNNNYNENVLYWSHSIVVFFRDRVSLARDKHCHCHVF